MNVQNKAIEVTSLPDTAEKVEAMNFDTMAELVVDLAHPETQYKGISGMQTNSFLAYAAIRLAKEYKEKVIDGEGYYVNPNANGSDF